MFNEIIDIWPQGEQIRIRFGGRAHRAIGGRGGIKSAKKEGDGATPAGLFPLRRIFYRADRIKPPQTGLPTRPLAPDDGWCDAPQDRKYNQWVRLPYQAHAERLWRADQLYDVIIVIGFNDTPVRAGHGSAIFIHLAAPDRAPTEGCIALAQDDLRALLKIIGIKTKIRIRES